MTLFDRIAKRIAASSAEYGLSRLDGSPKAALLEKHASAMTSVVRIENQELLFYAPFPGLRFRAETALSREPDTRAWIDGFETGGVFWDIGANVGVYSLYATLRRQCRSIALHGGHIRAFRATSSDSGIRFRSGMVAAASIRFTSHFQRRSPSRLLEPPR